MTRDDVLRLLGPRDIFIARHFADETADFCLVSFF